MNSLILSLQKNNKLTLLFFLITTSCINPPVMSDILAPVKINQGVKGKIIYKEGFFTSDGEIEGNGKIYAVERVLYVYERISISEIEMGEGNFINYIPKNPLDTVRSDKHGFFQIELPVGNYSFVVEENNRLYSKVNSDDYLMPVSVEENKVTELLFEIDYKAMY
jgi:hypothetical protein